MQQIEWLRDQSIVFARAQSRFFVILISRFPLGHFFWRLFASGVRNHRHTGDTESAPSRSEAGWNGRQMFGQDKARQRETRDTERQAARPARLLRFCVVSVDCNAASCWAVVLLACCIFICKFARHRLIKSMGPVK